MWRTLFYAIVKTEKRYRYAKAIHLVRLALQKYEVGSDVENLEYANNFIKEYIGEDIDEMDLPKLEAYTEDDVAFDE